MKKLTTKQIIDIILIIVLLIFAGQNVASVHLKFLVVGFDLPLIILIAFVFFIGYLTALLFRTPGKQDNKTSKDSAAELPSQKKNEV
jgi:uncharacterized integral membrane protein